MNPGESFLAVLAQAQSYLPEQDLDVLKKAYTFSLKSHETQLRAGGEPYIVHPLAVAKILSDLHMDASTLAAGLLHDVVEDTGVTQAQLEQEFGKEISHLVLGVTKIETIESRSPELHFKDIFKLNPEVTKQAENWRKMLIATAQDIRVIILKLADRKHNMETLQYLDEEKRKRISEETLTLYAPMAQRLGMYELKVALEDLSFKHLEPALYADIDKKISEIRVRRDEFLQKALYKLEELLRPQNIPFRISARPKNIYSIYRKMRLRNKPFEDIQDHAGVRLITDTVEHCYALLGAVQAQFKPVDDSFTDYISIPKSNLYQSLHVTVQIFDKDIIEIQIRTEDMHRIAEFGVAAHWRYKLGGKGVKPPSIEDPIDERLDWIKQVLDWQNDTKHPQEFLEGLKVELEFNQVFVFTPKGRVIKLPAGSTPVDFAFAVHSDLGRQCVGAKVNDKMVRLDYALKSGDRCEIQTRKGQEPHKDWLEFVKTPRAKSRIRKFLRERN